MATSSTARRQVTPIVTTSSNSNRSLIEPELTAVPTSATAINSSDSYTAVLSSHNREHGDLNTSLLASVPLVANLNPTNWLCNCNVCNKGYDSIGLYRSHLRSKHRMNFKSLRSVRSPIFYIEHTT
jgi:hypothetical protein